MCQWEKKGRRVEGIKPMFGEAVGDECGDGGGGLRLLWDSGRQQQDLRPSSQRNYQLE